MRCLYCDKKLSLLKLAKGDSYCSPAHFDAHQLQISKSAFDRLTSIPAHDTPKTPLVIKMKDEPVAPVARIVLNDTAETARQTLVMARLAAVQAPPFATFSKPPLPLNPLGPPSPKGSEPQLTARTEVAFPAHVVEVTAGLVALHLRLKDSELAPLVCAPAPSSAPAPEDFPPQLMYPSLAIEGGIQEVEEAPFDASERAPLIETAPPHAALPLDTAPAPNKPDTLAPLAGDSGTPILPVNRAKPVRPQIDPRVPFLTAPSFRERSVDAIPLGGAASSIPNLPSAPSILASPQAMAESRCAVASSTALAGIAKSSARSEHVSLLQSAPPLHAAAIQFLSAVRREENFAGWRTRNGPANVTFPIADTARPTLQADEFAAPSLSLARPEVMPVLGLERLVPVTQPLVPRSLAAKPGAQVAPRDPPQPEEPERNSPAGPAAFTLEKPAMTSGPLLAWVSRTLPANEAMIFVNLTASALEFGFRATSAFLRTTEIPDRTWKRQSGTFALPALIADQSVAASVSPAPEVPAPACRKTEPARLGDAFLARSSSRQVIWMQRDSGLASGLRPKPSPEPSKTQPTARCLPLTGIGSPRSMAQRPAVVRTPDRPFVATPWTPFKPEEERPAGLAFVLPNAGASLIGGGQIASGTVSARWDPRRCWVTDARILKFLPVRQGPSLPPARNWPQLGPPPR